MRAVQITEFGGPEVLNPTELPNPVAGPGEVLIEVSRAGINYADTHQAEDSYLSRSTLPMIPGGEVVGRASDGRRVVALTGSGGYAEWAVAPAATVWEVPDEVDDVTALGMVVQGVTAWLLYKRSVHLQPGESVVVHAAAGGVGTIAVQLAKVWGAGRVIATASSEDKRELALGLGADIAVDAGAEDMKTALIEANEGRRVDIVLEMTGGPVTDQSLRALAPFGRLGFYGMASRTPPSPVKPANLMAHSTTIAGMWLPHVFMLPGDVMGTALGELFGLAAEGRVRVIPGGEYGLADARTAHDDLRARRSTGKLVLDPAR